jgi:hypothetical protein
MKIMTSQQKMSRTTITETPGEHKHTAALLPQPVYSALKMCNQSLYTAIKTSSLSCVVKGKRRSHSKFCK